MEFEQFLRELLGITEDFVISNINKDETKKVIKIHIKYKKSIYQKEGKEYKIYDTTPEREWQHLNWFEYSCYLVSCLPRYVGEDGLPKVIEINFAPKFKGYTHLFANKVIETLQSIKVQQTVANLFNTSTHIVRSIMESAVEYGVEQKGETHGLRHVSIDEKAYSKGHRYATILIDSDKNQVVEMMDGRSEAQVRALFFSLNSEELHPTIQRVNIDMWKPYIHAMKDIAPKAMIVHDKFHLFKKLSEAINSTRKIEVKEHPQLRGHKYTVLKNQENRTLPQQQAFKVMLEDNLETAKAWLIRENFKSLFAIQADNTSTIIKHYDIWKQNALDYDISAVNKVIKTFARHLTGIVNAIQTQTSSAKHENLNGQIQSVLAKARGFVNFERFRVNILFYFGNLQLIPQKFY